MRARGDSRIGQRARGRVEGGYFERGRLGDSCHARGRRQHPAPADAAARSVRGPDFT